MKIAAFCFDFFIDAVMAAQNSGHEIVKIYSFPAHGVLNEIGRTCKFAAEQDVPIQFHRARIGDLKEDLERGVDLFLSAGYPFKVPTFEGFYGWNLHPSLLPQGRGAFPIPWLILNPAAHAAGLTLHELTDEWDAGSIVAQLPVPIASDDDLLTLCAKIRVSAVDFLVESLANFDRLRHASLPQSEQASRPWKASESDWTLDWRESVEMCLRRVRAFGPLETVATINGATYDLSEATGWTSVHRLEPGTLVWSSPSDMVVACADGYVLLRKFRPSSTA